MGRRSHKTHDRNGEQSVQTGMNWHHGRTSNVVANSFNAQPKAPARSGPDRQSSRRLRLGVKRASV